MLRVLAEGAIIHHNELPMPAIWFGVITLGIMVALAFVTWSYRDVSHRHSHKAGSAQAEH